MLKNPEDRRARRTRKLLKESLLALMREKPFAEISVRDVTDRADVNRTTFYLHYADTAQLLQSAEEDLLLKARELIDAHVQETVADGSMRPVFEPVLDFVVEHRELCAMLIENNKASRFVENLQQMIQHSGAEIVRARYHSGDDRQLSYLLEFLTYGLIGLLLEWFRDGMSLPKNELLKEAELLADGATARLLTGK